MVNYVNSFNWTIDPVTLETEANISCVAVNDVGQGRPDFINIQVIGKGNPASRAPANYVQVTTYVYKTP